MSGIPYRSYPSSPASRHTDREQPVAYPWGRRGVPGIWDSVQMPPVLSGKIPYFSLYARFLCGSFPQDILQETKIFFC